MRRTPISKIQLTDEEKKKLLDEIAAFYDDRGEEIGVIMQQDILDMFMEEMAPIVYNKALDDAKMWYKKQQENMDSDYYMLYKNE